MSRTSDDVSLTFSREEEIKYVRRFEEGYDLPDPRYKAWLSIHHPGAVSSEVPNCTSQTGFSPQTEVVTPSQSMSTMSNQSMPSHVGLVELRRIELSTLPGVETSPEPVSTLLDQSTPNHLTMRPGQLTDQSPVSMPTVTLLEPTSMSSITPDSSGVGLSTKTTPRCSPLSDLVNIPTVQPKKTGFARVLTSSECLKGFKDKEEKKRLAEEEKQRQKEERELKKKQKEEMKRKSELKAQKAAEREAKQQQKQSGQQTKGKVKRKSDNAASSRPVQKKARSDNADEEIDTGRCCVCFGNMMMMWELTRNG
ncbi:chromatin assembly factor 1 subunit A-like [Dysidea avara]|uniref:chromatin assembly factor 1 subunit A-like n=1 Tax=Dysidea avara TaxID=196820 RepID=UPI0033190515